MKRLIVILLVVAGLVLAALIAPVLLDDPGHVVLDVGQWRIEMTLLALVGGILGLWVALSVVSALLRLPAKALRRMREARSRRQLENGFLALAEGDWPRAERLLEKSLQYRHSTAGYLAAARAAQGRGDPAGRDRLLQLADARYGRRHFVTGLARARLLMGDGRVEDAVPILEQLHLGKRRHTGVLRLLLECYQDLGRWRDMRLLTPALQRAGVVDRERGSELAAHAAQREIESCPDVGQLERTWKELDRTQRRRRELVLAYARRCTELGRPNLAGQVLARALASELDDELLRAYADAPDNERAERIQRCEKWLETHQDHGGLHLALGLMYLDEREYDKARHFLEQAVRELPSSEAYAALGRVLDRSGSLEGAAQCYRNALRLKSGRGPEPLPPPREGDEGG